MYIFLFFFYELISLLAVLAFWTGFVSLLYLHVSFLLLRYIHKLSHFLLLFHARKAVSYTEELSSTWYFPSSATIMPNCRSQIEPTFAIKVTSAPRNQKHCSGDANSSCD